MNIPPYGDTFKRALLQLGTLKVKAQDTPNLTVKISAGGFWYYTNTGATFIEYAGGNSSAITAPGTNSKFVIISINSSGSIVNIDGTSGVSPVLPAIVKGRFPLAAVHINFTDTSITEDMIFDLRPVFEMSVRDHSDLLALTATGSHPATAVSFAPGGSGLVSTDVNAAIVELKVLFDDLYVHAGNNGTSGTSGLTGTSGTSGTRGTSGTSGTSGTTGAVGTTGAAGTSGTSGTDGLAGTSGTSA